MKTSQSRADIVQSVEHTQEVSYLSRTNAWYVKDICSPAMLATKRSAGITPQVYVRKHVTCTPPPSGIRLLTLKSLKSKTGVLMTRQKWLMSTKILKKNSLANLMCVHTARQWHQYRYQDNKLQQYSMALLSRRNVKTYTQFYTTHFYRWLCPFPWLNFMYWVHFFWANFSITKA